MRVPSLPPSSTSVLPLMPSPQKKRPVLSPFNSASGRVPVVSQTISASKACSARSSALQSPSPREFQHDPRIVDIPDASSSSSFAETSELEAPADSSSYMSDPDAIYLHLEAARARQAVVRARVHLATCELSEHMCRTRLDRLKVEHFEKALATVNSNVGQWCDNIRRSGRPLHSYSLMLRRTPRRRQLDLAPHPDRCAEFHDEEFFVDLQ